MRILFCYVCCWFNMKYNLMLHVSVKFLIEILCNFSFVFQNIVSAKFYILKHNCYFMNVTYNIHLTTVTFFKLSYRSDPLIKCAIFFTILQYFDSWDVENLDITISNITTLSVVNSINTHNYISIYIYIYIYKLL